MVRPRPHTHALQVFDAIKEERCARTFGLHHKGHPYVDQIYADGDFLVGGDLEVLGEIGTIPSAKPKKMNI